MLCVLAFAATLTFRDFGPELAINVPWLIRLAADSIGDSAYLNSLEATATAHIFLFGSLIAGGQLPLFTIRRIIYMETPVLAASARITSLTQ